MKKKYVHALGLWVGLAIANHGVAQNVGVNAIGATPNASTILDLNTGNTFTSPNGKGLLIPNVALTGTGDATTVTSPATSLMVYNTATAGSGATAVIPGYYYWDGTKWVQFQSSSNASQDWKLTGNAGTTAGTNFVGTTDAVDFVTKTNNAERMRVTSAGNVGIGTSAPSASLSIVATATNTGFQLKDGSEAAGKVLTSDANGVASWNNASAAIPAGAVFYFSGSIAPTGYLECDGSAVSRTTYAALFAIIGTTYGAGNGSTTFNLPDLRGEFIRGWDHGRAVDAGRAIGTSQTYTVQSHNHSVDPPNTLTDIQGNHSHVAVDGNGLAFTGNTGTGNNGTAQGLPPGGSGFGSNWGTGSTNAAGNHQHNLDIAPFNSASTGGTETRPRNVALMACIKY